MTTRLALIVASTAAAVVALAGCGSSATPAAVTSSAPSQSAAPTPTRPVVAVATYAGCPAPGAAIDVCNATFDIPAWGPGSADPNSPCPVTAVKMVNGLYPTAQGDPSDGIRKFVIADVDHDGRPDAVVLLSCHLGDPPLYQAMVVAQTASGSLRTLGQVVGPTQGDILFVDDISADTDGTIRALVAAPHGSIGGEQALRQWRTYSWDGQRFNQTAGSTSFDAAPGSAQLSLKTGAIAFAPAQGGQRKATFTVTVTNTGPTVANAVSAQVVIDVETSFTTTSSQCPVGDLARVPSCYAGDLAPGASRSFSVTLAIPTAEVSTFQSNWPDGSPGAVRLMLGDQRLSQSPLPRATF